MSSSVSVTLSLSLSLCFPGWARASTWFPLPAEPGLMLGEQMDLVDVRHDPPDTSTPIPDWIDTTPCQPIDDSVVTPSSSSSIDDDPLHPSVRSREVGRDDDGGTSKRDREPLDEVENIGPRQWSRDVPLTRSNSPPSTTEATSVRKDPDPTTLAQRNPSTQRYPTTTVPPSTATVDEVFCDFGPLPVQSLCEWQNGKGDLRWTPGTGLGTNWLGGPPTDSTAGTMEGGYAFVETSRLPTKEVDIRSPGGLLHSPQLGSTGVSGTCFMFKYAMDGLSSAGLRVILHVGIDENSIRRERTEVIASADNATVVESQSTTTTTTTTTPSGEERVLWQAQYYTLGVWQQARILYTYPDIHSLIIEGVPVDAADPSRLYRGYVAVDDIDLQPGTSCTGFCNFAGGFCDWSNDAEDDFDWTISRGSADPTTGPAMDSSSDRATAGGYAYIDSSFPRRPGDIAKLIGTSFPATGTDGPMCMHFWFHMFGSGIGNLKIYVRHFRSSDAATALEEIWGLSGNAGNAWFMSEVTISSLDDFQLVFEASVGNTGMGDIAIDDITFSQGACPVSPQVAAPIPRDCTFEVDECEWINSRDPDRVEWERVSSQVLSPRNQRKPYSNGHTVGRRNEYFIGLGRSRGGLRAAGGGSASTSSGGTAGGGTAQLVSREMKGSAEPLCITFWYFMFESFIDSTGPSLGVLRVSVQPVGAGETWTPIWQLYNNQGPTWNYAQARINERRNFNIAFEGTWGPNRASGSIGIDDVAFFIGNCTSRPSSAYVRPEDCSFEKGLCGWENITSSGSDRTVMWQRAFVTHRPAQLLDKTFGATGDFVFFDIFTTNQKSSEVQLRSPPIGTSPDEETTCFTFWFAAFGVEESTTLKVVKVPVDNEGSGGNAESGFNGNGDVGKEPLWVLTAKGFNNPRPVWTAAQVTVDARSPYRLVLEGKASNGGFAIDDVKFLPRSCTVRPVEALPSANNVYRND